MSKYKCVRQHDAADCGAACIATVCLYYGKETTITKLRDMSGTDIKGVTTLGIVETLSKLGFEARAWRLSSEGFVEDFTLPAIARVLTKEGLAHFVVVNKIYYTKDNKSEKISNTTNKGSAPTRRVSKLLVSDPAKGLVTVPADEFFDDFDGNLILTCPSNDFVVDNQKVSGTFRRFSGLLFAQKKLFALAIVGSVILTLLSIASAFFNQILMDDILPYNLKNQLLYLCIGFGVIGIFQVLLGAARQHLLLHLSLKIDIPLMLGYFKHIFGLPMKFFGTRRTGDILTRFQDAGTITKVFTQIALSLVIDLMLILVSGIILFAMNPTLFGIIVILTLLNAILVYAFLRPYKRLNLESMEKQALLSSQTIDSLRGVETVKSFGAEQHILDKIENRFVASTRVGYRSGVLQNVQGSLGGFVSTFGNLILMGIAALRVMNGDITLGSMMAFMSLSSYFMDPIGRLVGLQIQIQEAQIAMKRISELYDLEPEQSGVDNLKRDLQLECDADLALPLIQFKDITFRYGSRVSVLNNISLDIYKGQKIAIVGQSGSGKTTLAKLCLGLWTLESGNILVNGTDIKDIDHQVLRQTVAYVPQNVELFSGTILENVRLGKQDATIDQVKLACQKAGCSSLVESLPAKYDTYLEEAGANLSGGQKQSLALARALIKNPSILILDESTSSLDFVSEARIYDNLFDMDCTMVIVAHRLSTIRRCDKIVVVDNRKVVESGVHDELLSSGGVYSKMWYSQIGAA